MNIILRILLSSAAVGIGAYILPGITVDSLLTVVIVAIVIGALNMVVKPILVLLTLPINIITLGLFTLVINAVIIILASKIVPGFIVANFWWAVLFSIVVSIVSSFLASLKK